MQYRRANIGTSFEYDANGNLTRLIDAPGQDTLTQYDALKSY